jgi:hypothetical protein
VLSFGSYRETLINSRNLYDLRPLIKNFRDADARVSSRLCLPPIALKRQLAAVSPDIA